MSVLYRISTQYEGVQCTCRYCTLYVQYVHVYSMCARPYTCTCSAVKATTVTSSLDTSHVEPINRPHHHSCDWATFQLIHVYTYTCTCTMYMYMHYTYSSTMYIVHVYMYIFKATMYMYSVHCICTCTNVYTCTLYVHVRAIMPLMSGMNIFCGSICSSCCVVIIIIIQVYIVRLYIHVYMIVTTCTCTCKCTSV